jgi:hypothetical protein
VEIENRVRGNSSRRRKPLKAFGEMREMPIELPTRSAPAHWTGQQPTQVWNTRSLRRQADPLEFCSDRDSGRGALRKAHVSRMPRALDRRPHD